MSLASQIAVAATRTLPQDFKRWIHRQHALDMVLRNLYGSLTSASQPVVISQGPMRGIRLQPGTHISHKHLDGQYEAETLAALDRYVPSGAICYDFGASIGYLSLLMARKAKAVYAFEPAPHALEEIRRQAGLNGFSNIYPVQQVVSGDVRDVEFALAINAYGSRIDSGTARREAERLKFRTTTLDAIARQYPPPDFIKMDVEGEEYAVLRGGEQTIRAKRPTFCIELHSEQLASDCVAFLESLGYRITELDGSPLRKHEKVRAGDLQVMAFPQ